VKEWGDYFAAQGIDFENQRDGHAVFVKDPAGNYFEIYYDPTVFIAPESLKTIAQNQIASRGSQPAFRELVSQELGRMARFGALIR